MKTSKLYITIITGLLIFSCSINDNSNFSNCDTQNLGINQTFRYTPTGVNNPNGTPIFSNDVWKWSKSNDTIIVGGSIISEGESASEMYMFFKKTCGCIDLLYVKVATWGDQVFLDENGNIVSDDTGAYDLFNNEFIRQTYIEDSILVGEVNGTKFWIEFSPQYRQTEPWGYENISNP